MRFGNGSESSASDFCDFLAITIGTVFGKASVANPNRKFWLPTWITMVLEP